MGRTEDVKKNEYVIQKGLQAFMGRTEDVKKNEYVIQKGLQAFVGSL
jgi:hypothetical protein